MIGTIGRLGVMPHILYQRGNNAPITGTIVPFCYRGDKMKNMSVEELLNHLGDIAFYGDAEHWNKAAHELLRRFKELEKENKRLRYVINGVTIKIPRANDPSNLDTY